MMQMQLLTSHWQDAQPVLEEWLRPQTTLPIFYSAWRIWDGMGHHFGWFESVVLLLSLPISLCIPSLLAGRAAREARKSLTQCKHCSETTKISVCYQHCFPHKAKTQHHTRNYVENQFCPSWNYNKVEAKAPQILDDFLRGYGILKFSCLCYLCYSYRRL